MSKARISINKLGEYLTASPARRRRIVKDQKEPSTFIVARYADARQEIVTYMEGGMTNDDALANAAAHLRQAPGTDFVRQDKANSADAIEDFLEVADQLNFDGLTVEPTDPTASASMEIANVTVSVRPEVLLRDELTGDVVGAVKLHFPKTAPLTEKAPDYVATTLREYLALNYDADSVDPKRCYVVDVPTRSVTCATKANKKKMSDVEAACEEVNARWQMSG